MNAQTAHSRQNSVWWIFTRYTQPLTAMERRQAKLLNSIILATVIFSGYSLTLELVFGTLDLLNNKYSLAAIFALVSSALVYRLNKTGRVRLAGSLLFIVMFGAIWGAAIPDKWPSDLLMFSYMLLPIMLMSNLFGKRVALWVALACIVLPLVIMGLLTMGNPALGEYAFHEAEILVILGMSIILLSRHRDGTEAMCRDGVARQAAELAAERERRNLIESFMKDASHDLKTPLAALVTSAYLLEKQVELHLSDAQNRPTQDDISRRAAGMRDDAMRLSRMVEGMFDLLRLDNRDAYQFAPCSLNTVVEAVLRTAQLRLQDSPRRLRFFPGGDLPQILADEDEIRRVVQNLIENAIRYTTEEAVIDICTRVQGNNVTLIVKDTGIGIASDDLPHVFERFYRANSARSTHIKGSGLGLSIVKAIVEAHGGTIQVESELGRGTVFRVLLPSC